MNWSAWVMSTVSADSEPSIMVTFDDAKYLFNAGENTVRTHCHSEATRRRMKGLFLTQLSLERAGGVPGLLMTVADACSINDLSIIGPEGLAHQLASARLYTFRDNLRVLPLEVPTQPLPTPAPVFKDRNLSVYALPLSVAPTYEASNEMEVDTPLKRKRDPSPEAHRKKLIMGQGTSTSTDDPATKTPPEPSLNALMSAPNFKPESLPPKLADEWRHLVVRRMFPTTGAQYNDAKGAKASETRTGKKGKAANESKNNGKSKTQTSESESIAPSATSIPEDKGPGNVDEYRRSRGRPPKGFYDILPAPAPSVSARNAVAYVVVGPRIRGKFNIQKAIALGVPNGPLRGKLTKGETITFTVKDKVTGVGGELTTVERTVTVKSEECVGETEAPSVTIILDVPTKDHIPSLLQQFESSALFSKMRSPNLEDRKEHQVKALFHMTGDGVLEDPEYIEFMQGFGEDVQHIVASREHCPNPVTFTSAAANQLRMNKLDKDIFPLQTFRMEPRRLLSSIPNLPRNTHVMASNLKVGIRPAVAAVKDTNAIAHDDFHPLLANQLEDGTIPVELSEAALEAFAEAQKHMKDAEQAIEAAGVKKPGDDIVIVPLGTGSAVPGKYRTVSSTLIQVPKWGNILLDAGEGTYYQLARHFGEEGVKDVLRDLKCLYVSHLHADHHLGVAMLLRKRLELVPAPDHPLYLVSIRAVHLGLRERQQLEDLGIQDISPDVPGADSGNGVITVMSESLHYKRPGVYATTGPWGVGGNEPWVDIQKSVANSSALCRSLGLSKISTVDMNHGTRCFGLVLRHIDGWTIAFSGDTEATENLVQAGQGATLLIHEATMADDQADMAKAKKHSTFGQAIDIGKRMRAENILLTHFSARHPKIPMTHLDINSGSAASSGLSPRDSSTPTVAMAFDLSSMRIGDMWKMQHYLPALEQIYKDTAEDGEDEVGEGGAVDSVAVGL